MFACSRGRLTGAGRVGGVAVSAVETTLAGTNIGSSCTGATVRWAGSTGSLPKFRFEGPRDASWMGGRGEKKTIRTKQNKTKALCACQLKNSGCHICHRTKTIPVKYLQSSISI